MRRGQPKALLAVGHSTLVIAYHLLRNQTIYQDVSSILLVERRRQQAEHRAIRQLRALGSDVALTPKPTAA